MTLAISVRNVSKSFGDRHVVRGLALTVDKGRITGLLGPNGSGKTTTLRLLCGLLRADSGEGEVLGLDFRTQSAAIRRRTGYVTQRFSLYDDMTVAENLSFVAQVYGLDARARRVDQAVRRLGLADRRGELAGALSGGWKQRLALAAATLHEPELLLLDEPTAGIDPQARRAFWEDIQALAGQGVTVLVSTHDMAEAERCRDIAYLLQGRVVARGAVAEIIRQSSLAAFVGEGPDVEAAAHDLALSAGVAAVTLVGSTVRVTGVDRPALQQAIEKHRGPPNAWSEATPSLEEAFLQLMADRPDANGPVSPACDGR
ncbi:MAG: ABC transporter ATP-binding protein [Caulobacterales bacterium]